MNDEKCPVCGSRAICQFGIRTTEGDADYDPNTMIEVSECQECGHAWEKHVPLE